MPRVSPPNISKLYHQHILAARRERMFLASISFFVTFGLVRLITYAVKYSIGPFHDVVVGATHVHHLVAGIFLLLIVGYLWLIELGTGEPESSQAFSRILAILYGVGAALTLDEFALWLNLRDVYWEHEGRISVDAALLFGGLVSIGLWGKPFFLAVGKELLRLARFVLRWPPR
ncbi:MAG: hypothetical protein HY092_01450 [Candidatus Kerfeldbacteria bacterium]|nr:hypothetical protein [Candidatus Kerfeldbacteria bacterium]